MLLGSVCGGCLEFKRFRQKPRCLRIPVIGMLSNPTLNWNPRLEGVVISFLLLAECISHKKVCSTLFLLEQLPQQKHLKTALQ